MRPRACLCAIGVVLMTIIPNGLPSRAMQPCQTEGSLLTPHAPILIVDDSGFTSANGVTSGDGTPANPYVIEGWDISTRFANGIEIRNTLAHFLIRNVFLHGECSTSLSDYHDGVLFNTVRNGRIEAVESRKAWLGVQMIDSADVAVADSIFSGSVDAGLLIFRSTGVMVSGNRLDNNHLGFDLDSSSGVSLTGNTILDNRGEVNFSSDSVISANRFQGNAYLIFRDSLRIKLSGNLFDVKGVNLIGSTLDDFNSHTITADNLIGGLPIYQLKDCAGATLEGVPAGQVLVANCSDIRIAGLNLREAFNAIQLAYVVGGLIQGNTIANSYPGIDVISSSGLTFTGNTLTRNFGGIVLQYTTGSLVFGNRFLVSPSVDSGTTNSWDNGYPAGGNYWSDYAGKDLCSGLKQDHCTGGDDLGDTPHPVDPDTFDHYPIFGPGPGDPSQLKMTVQPIKPVYRAGEPVDFKISLSNPAQSPVNFVFPATCQASFTIQDGSGATIYDFYLHSGCYPAESYLSLLSGETADFGMTWSQKNDTGSPVPVPGSYRVTGKIVNHPEVPGASAAFLIQLGCSDGLDNDGDGLVDYPADAGCKSATDNDETEPLFLTLAGNMISWNSVPNAIGYDVVQGDLTQLIAGRGTFSSSIIGCLENDGSATSTTSLRTPSLGKGLFYLARPVNLGGVGTWDSDGPGQVAPRFGVDASNCACP